MAGLAAPLRRSLLRITQRPSLVYEIITRNFLAGIKLWSDSAGDPNNRGACAPPCGFGTPMSKSVTVLIIVLALYLTYEYLR
jgi:hypothetical protein